MSDSFQRVLDHIRSIAGTETEKGRLFERLMKAYFVKDPLYRDRFSDVWLWSEWAPLRPDFAGGDTGIDLVADERGGGLLRYPVQVLCAGHADVEGASQFLRLSIGARAVHGAHRCRYRR